MEGHITLIIPPFTQLNTSYPSISYLARHLQGKGIPVRQRDLSIELALRVFSTSGLRQIFDIAEQSEELPESAWEMISARHRYEKCIGPVIRLLQHREHSLAHRIQHGHFLPQGPRVRRALESGFGDFSIHDQARFLCTQFLSDITDFIKVCIDIGFDFGRYQAQLATGPITLDPILQRLSETTIIDQWLDEICDGLKGDLFGISIPFPGTLYGALRIGRQLKARGKIVCMGGGYINTELREIRDSRFWDFCDHICLDDGETPLEALIAYHRQEGDRRHRSISPAGHHTTTPLPPNVDSFAPDYGDLDRSLYLQLIDDHNPTHRLWSDGCWNKITLAHGCYWKKCAFCDINLDYISRYRPTQTVKIVNTMQQIIEDTGFSGFHLVDEAAPPRLLKELALEILKRDMVCSWWGNIRFEKAFTPDLCRLLAAAGMIAATGGLEVANDRLLKKMKKGVTLQQAVQSAQALEEAGIMVHAYLMYGFPTQTNKETLEAMEYVRQMFQHNILRSAFWHRFVLTQHSGIFANLQAYDIHTPPLSQNNFAQNDIPHHDPQGGDHDLFNTPLEQSLWNWMRKQHIHKPLQYWFQQPIPKITVSPNHVKKLMYSARTKIKNNHQLLWIGDSPLISEEGLTFPTYGTLPLTEEEQDWVLSLIDATSPTEPPIYRRDIEMTAADEELLEALRQVGLLTI